ncbi:hypothetical protein BpHYR1_037404 [Brachionus plicatilis]|uniref:Uncharacterized protein n=1 Tax=Brachionus plicatilis TaxID=10195 RepID=A0A3M7SQ61_BRAPC|nr:hypothetical protein BpHYR1_037404 [Brachionus plicatilis]
MAPILAIVLHVPRPTARFTVGNIIITGLSTHILIRKTNMENTPKSMAIVFFLPNSSIIVIVIKRPGNSDIVLNMYTLACISDLEHFCCEQHNAIIAECIRKPYKPKNQCGFLEEEALYFREIFFSKFPRPNQIYQMPSDSGRFLAAKSKKLQILTMEGRKMPKAISSQVTALQL